MIFYAISDRRLEAGGSLFRQLDKYLRLGADWIQLREKDLSDRELLEAAGAASRKAEKTGAKVIVNGRADIASLSGAAGVQLPSDSPPVEKIKAAFPGLTVIKSCHTLEDVRRAEAAGADLVTVGPVFETPSKKGIIEPMGLSALSDICSACNIPVIALGGIGTGQAGQVADAGACGIAGIRLFNDPEAEEEDGFRAGIEALKKR